VLRDGAPPPYYHGAFPWPAGPRLGRMVRHARGSMITGTRFPANS
jgi:hypothetical protein